jgi:CRISPR-associated endonuclease/helicase Cas3
VAQYISGQAEQLRRAVRLAAEFHDLGKLDEANQAVLASGTSRPLPLNHADAGVAHLLGPAVQSLLAGSLAFAHHAGLPDFADQRNNKQGYVLRDTAVGPLGEPTKNLTDQRLPDYLAVHRAAISNLLEGGAESPPLSPAVAPPLFWRIALSCLVDADHYNTACHYNPALPCEGPPLQARNRLGLLDAYTRSLAELYPGGRTALRSAIYQACRNADPTPNICACASPVGTGKTTAVMAHLLQAAAEKGLRRVFVVLPFTNIINQSVEVYRRALVETGEAEEEVVAAHHHRLEFEKVESRQFAFLWHAPVVVTTAVQFFETLASNRPAALRKLHRVPGSAIFIDEAHAALPAHLWPQAWQWLRELASVWSCHLVLGSGSLTRFWQLEEFSDPPAQVPDLLPPELSARAAIDEEHRVRYLPQADRLTLKALLEWLPKLSGPRLLIVNTVQSAAAIAGEISEVYGRHAVEHLSTSLCPRDRDITLKQVKQRLEDKSDRDWTLVATSCVEAGLDLSFRTGLRERCSLNSLIQVGGRVNRKGEVDEAYIWDFQLQHEEPLRHHPAFETSARVVGELFAEDHISPEWCTEAMRREIRQDGLRSACDEILKAERAYRFPDVADRFTVIDSHTVTAIVDEQLVKKLEHRERVSPNQIQTLSVQIWKYRGPEYGLAPIVGFPGLYAWKLMYDHFLGYMAGVLQLRGHEQHGSIV